jgi:hypothetical protein
MGIKINYSQEEVQAAIKAAKVRFNDKVNYTGPLMPGMVSRCWEWQGSGLQDGYGQFRIEVRGVGLLKMPHNCAWVLAGGELPPKGFDLHHLCGNPRCVNPNHLAMVTRAGHRRQHTVIIISATCPRGHLFDEETPLIDSKGYRRCRECAKIYRSRYNGKRGKKNAT